MEFQVTHRATGKVTVLTESEYELYREDPNLKHSYIFDGQAQEKRKKQAPADVPEAKDADTQQAESTEPQEEGTAPEGATDNRKRKRER